MNTPLSFPSPTPLVIELSEMEFHCRHGVLPQERETGGNFCLNLTVSIDAAQAHGALCHDRLKSTVNYADLYNMAREEINIPSQLLEHVAGRIARRIVGECPLVREVKVKLRKSAPPISGFAGLGASVEYTHRRTMVVWDFDGTIADTSSTIVSTMQATFAELGIEVPDADAIRRTIGLPLLKSTAMLAGIDEDCELNLRAQDTYRRLFFDFADQGVELFPGVREEMEREKACGQFVCIGTSRGHDSVDTMCESLGIRHLIDRIVACEDVATHKPDPAPVLLLCEMMNVLPTDTTVIGDTTFDIGMGRNAGAPNLIGVNWGNHSPAQLLEAGATRIVDHF